MLSEMKYSDNIIFQKGAVDELLTNIKNYPIIDIDYVEESEVDETHGDAIWQNYTDRSPCIKITYGDESTTRGNSMFAADFRKAKAKGRAKIIILSNQIRGIEEQKRLWEKVYRQNKEIYDRRYALLQQYRNEFGDTENGIATGIARTLIEDPEKGIESFEKLQNDYNSGFDAFWNDTYYPVGSNNPLLQKIKITYDPHLYGHPPDNSYSALTTYYQKTGENTYTAVASSSVNESNYLEYYIQLKIEEYFAKIQNNGMDALLARINGYLGSSNITETERTAFQQLKQDVIDYPNYNSTNQSFSSTALNALWTKLANFLVTVVNSSNIKMTSAETIWTYYKNLVGDTEDQIERLETMIGICDTCADLIAGGTKAVKTTSNNIKAIRGQTITFNSYEAVGLNGFIDAVALGKTQLSATNDLINASGNNRSVVGYKYVKVGSNISFEHNLASTANYGTFVITINGEDTAVPIKGFQNSDNENLVANTRIIPNSATGGSLGSGQYTQATAYNPNSQYYDSNGNNVTSSVTSANYANYYVYTLDKPWDYIYAKHLGWPDAPVSYAYLLDIRPGNGATASYVGKLNNPYSYGYINNLIPPATTSASTSGSTVGNSDHPYANGYFNQINIGGVTIGGSGGSGDMTKFLRNDGTWADTLHGSFSLAANKNAYLRIGAFGIDAGTSANYGTSGNAGLWYNGSSTDVTTTVNGYTNVYKATTLYCDKYLAASRVYNAVFNDYAECRKSTIVAPGYTVIDQDDGTMIPSSERLQPGAQIVSDTYGNLMGETPEAKTPIAVAGRALAYTYRPREEYHAGMAVCSAPGGTIDIMTREEIKEYPDCIVGIVSEIPNYDTWGSENIKVNGRIWIKVR